MVMPRNLTYFLIVSNIRMIQFARQLHNCESTGELNVCTAIDPYLTHYDAI